MIYLLIFLLMVFCFLFGVIMLQSRELKILQETLNELEVVILTMDRAKEFIESEKINGNDNHGL